MPTGSGKRLRCGFTTGVAAAAATKAAMVGLLQGQMPQRVPIGLPTGETLWITVHACHRPDAGSAACTVIKDAGDDPDITHGAEIGARVAWHPGPTAPAVTVRGGTGVGRVTRPGLEVPVGRAAINPVPLAMIRSAALDSMAAAGLGGHAEVEIFVPRGEELARHTLNERLGIVGGISILGTTGIVRPLSHEAYTATIRAAVSVARASGLTEAVMTTGRRSERFAQQLWPHRPAYAFVQIGDYFADGLEMAADQGLERVALAVFFGKALKMAMGLPHTHARTARLTLEQLGRWTVETTGDPDLARRVVRANTARAAFDLFADDYPALIARVGSELIQVASGFVAGRVTVRAVIFDFQGQVRFDGFAKSCCQTAP